MVTEYSRVIRRHSDHWILRKNEYEIAFPAGHPPRFLFANKTIFAEVHDLLLKTFIFDIYTEGMKGKGGDYKSLIINRSTIELPDLHAIEHVRTRIHDLAMCRDNTLAVPLFFVTLEDAARRGCNRPRALTFVIPDHPDNLEIAFDQHIICNRTLAFLPLMKQAMRKLIRAYGELCEPAQDFAARLTALARRFRVTVQHQTYQAHLTSGPRNSELIASLDVQYNWNDDTILLASERQQQCQNHQACIQRQKWKFNSHPTIHTLTGLRAADPRGNWFFRRGEAVLDIMIYKALGGLQKIELKG